MSYERKKQQIEFGLLKKDSQSYIILFNQILQETNHRLHGLPIRCQIVIHQLLSRCDITTGRIKGFTLEEMERDLYVAPAPGRKRQIIGCNAIRNAFRTIQKFSDDFKFSVEEQRIVIDMPFIKALYTEFCDSNKDAGVTNPEGQASITHVTLGLNPSAHDTKTSENSPENAAELTPHSPNITKQNITKQTQQREFSQWKFKKPITEDFYPSEATIAEALSMGFSQETILDPNQIQGFIAHNQQHQTRWSDFNRVYINWLINDVALRKREQDTLIQLSTRSNTHARTTRTGFQTKQPDYDELMASVQKACGASFHTNVIEQHDYTDQSAACGYGLDPIGSDLWSTVCP